MKLLYHKFWTVNYVKNHKTHLFIYGDNDVHRGAGGQAIIRYQSNAMGIPTKKYPGLTDDCFYTDKEFETNKINIDQAINKIIAVLPNYEAVVLPEDGFGTGLAQLNKRAPLTGEYLNKKVDEFKQTVTNFNNIKS